jgi:signal transduction histidine kinase
LRAPERALLANVSRSTRRLGRLIEDLLTFHRLESGTLQITLTQVDMCRVSTEALATMRPLLLAKKQTGVVLVSVPLPLLGDQLRLEQVVLNLLANAHRHTPPGTHITLTGRLEGDEVILVVEDNGPGIPPEQIEHIFDRFVQTGTTSSGSGLGLAITRALIELHGGRVWAENRPNGGAAFSVVLPRRGGV